MGKINPKLLALLVGSGVTAMPETSEASFGGNTWGRVKELLKYVKGKTPEQMEKALAQIYKESNENTLDATGFLDLNDLATKARSNRHEIMGGIRAANDPAYRELMNTPYSKDIEKQLMDMFQKELSSNTETKNIILDPINNRQTFQNFKDAISKSNKISRQEKVRILNDMDTLEEVYRTDKDGSSLMFPPNGKKGDPLLLKLESKDIKSDDKTANIAATLEGVKQHEVSHAKEFPYKYSHEETAHRNLKKATSKNNRVLELFGLKKADDVIEDYSAPKAMDILDQAQDYAHFDVLKDIPGNVQTLEQQLIREQLEKYRQGRRFSGIAAMVGVPQLDKKDIVNQIENLDELYKESPFTKKQKQPSHIDTIRAAKDAGMAIRGLKDITYGPVIDEVKEALTIGDDRSSLKNRIKDSAVELGADPMNLVSAPLSVGLGMADSMVDDNEYDQYKKRWKNTIGSIMRERPRNSVIDDIKE